MREEGGSCGIRAGARPWQCHTPLGAARDRWGRGHRSAKLTSWLLEGLELGGSVKSPPAPPTGTVALLWVIYVLYLVKRMLLLLICWLLPALPWRL